MPFNRNSLALTHDALMAFASFLLALYLRLGDATMAFAGEYMLPGGIVFTAICLAILIKMRLYRGLWRYASMQDLKALAFAVTIAILIFYFGMFILTRLAFIPRSVPFIHWLLLLAMFGGPRFLYRLLKDRRLSLDTLQDRRIPVLMIGANDHTDLFLRDMSHGAHTPYRIVGIVDERPDRIGQMMYNIRIYGGIDTLPRIVEKVQEREERPQRLILADEHMEGAKVRKLLDHAESLGIPLARLPRLTEFKASQPGKADIRPIAVEDLLGRAQNLHDRDAMRRLIAGKRVIVTGAGGTIGGELTRQVAGFEPSQLILLENSEYNLYLIDREISRRPRSALRAEPGTSSSESDPRLAQSAAEDDVLPLICDVRDATHVDRIFTTYKPEIVFHAAALKHVPIAEANPEEAVLTNVLGTHTIAEACAKHNVQAMVLISTDKAVNPANIMGATKRLAEGICQALAAEYPTTRYITVRFGNVLGSTGSVVPLFQKQLAEGGPLTVTHADMTRFFMTVREAVELVIQAAAYGITLEKGTGPVFVLDMGEPVKILDLATQMIRLAGLRPGTDIEIQFTGLRPGEKMYEELFYNAENSTKTSLEGIMLAKPRQVALSELAPQVEALISVSRMRESSKAIELLRALVPEYKPA